MEPQASRPPAESTLARLWRPAGLWYLAMCLAGLAAGLWPRVLYNPPTHPPELPLPTLATLAVGQVLFFLLIYPLVLLRREEAARADVPAAASLSSATVLESLVLLIVAAPFYCVAAYMGNAHVADVLRTVLCLLALLPLSWMAGVYLAWNNPARTLMMLGLLLVAVGLPAGVYLAHEFATDHLADRLWQVAPATFALCNGSPREGSMLPSPWWAWLLWPAVAAVLALVRTLVSKSKN